MANPGQKFGRAYTMAIQGAGNTVLNVNPNLTVEFDVTRNTLGSNNVAQIRIYNLSEAHRNAIRLNVTEALTQYRSFLFRAGYGTNLPTVFAGNISTCWSTREGSNFITTLECLDGGFAFVNGFINASYVAATNNQIPYTSLMKTVIQDNMPYISVGAIGGFEGSLVKSASFSQRTVDFLIEQTGNGFFVDNQKAYCLKDNECIQGQANLINASSGLLGTPVLQQTILTFDMLFEPALLVGQMVQLESLTGPGPTGPSPQSYQGFSGTYKVISLKHRGMISPTVCGEVITTVGLDSIPNLILVAAA